MYQASCVIKKIFIMWYWLGFGWTFRRVYWWRRQRFSRQPNPNRGGRVPMPRLQQGVEIYLRISGTHVKTAQKKQNKWCVQMVFSLCTAKSHYIKSVVFKLQTWSRYWILFALFDITNQKMFHHVIFVLFTNILLQQVTIEQIARPQTTVSRVLYHQWTLRKSFLKPVPAHWRRCPKTQFTNCLGTAV